MGARRYDGMIGTGGIGSGSFFALRGHHTLGREESRGGQFLDQRDYCKLHIIAHYVQRLMGPDFRVVPVGRLGDDEHGAALRQEMQAAGLDLRHVRTLAGKSTLFSFCFVYPDGSGGNMTVDDSACAALGPAEIREAEADIAALGARGIVLAVPEVPVVARLELLRLGTEHGCFRAASFISNEVHDLDVPALLPLVDFLALNQDEAAALAGVGAADDPAAITQALDPLLAEHELVVSITAGGNGSWLWTGDAWDRREVLAVPLATSAGAGDAHFAGLLCGRTAGLDWVKAHELAVLVAALSVTSRHTIHPDLSRASLAELAAAYGLELGVAEAVLEQ